MDMSKGRLVDGHNVHCDVIQLSTGLFKLEITTRPKDAEMAERVWQLPRARVFIVQDEAEHEARAVLRSVWAIDEAGQPTFLLS